MAINKFLDYLRYEKKYSQNTILSYENDLNEFQEYFKNHAYDSGVVKADTLMLRNYLMYLSDGELSERTINRKISALKSFYKFLLKTEQISTSPALGLKSLKHYNPVQLPFSQEELQDLLDSDIFPDDFEGIRDKLIIDLLYQTGMRRNELIQLKLQDVDFHENKLTVLGKRNKERIIPISEKLSQFILSYLDKRKEINPHNLPQIFLTKKGKPLYDKLVYNLVNYYLSHVSAKQKKSPHMLRHTFATHMLDQGAELNAVKEILGHSSLSATQIYTHGSIEQLKKVFNHAHLREQQKPKNYDDQITDSKF